MKNEVKSFSDIVEESCKNTVTAEKLESMVKTAVKCYDRRRSLMMFGLVNCDARRRRLMVFGFVKCDDRWRSLMVFGFVKFDARRRRLMVFGLEGVMIRGA